MELTVRAVEGNRVRIPGELVSWALGTAARQVEVHNRRGELAFRLPGEELDAKFVAESKKAGMVGLKGYRDVGGIRVSMYNAVTVENVKTLVSFMEEFVRKNG